LRREGEQARTPRRDRRSRCGGNPLMPELDGRVVLVTGGGRGIGREHCLELARHGADVVIMDPGVGLRGEPSPEDPAQEVAELVRALGRRSRVIEVSVTDWDSVREALAETVADLGRLDGIVNNAGILRDRMITSSSEADFDAVLAVHVKG